MPLRSLNRQRASTCPAGGIVIDRYFVIDGSFDWQSVWLAFVGFRVPDFFRSFRFQLQRMLANSIRTGRHLQTVGPGLEVFFQIQGN